MFVRRSRPLLGTLVEMRCEGLDERRAQAVLAAAFAEVAHVHRKMSFHERDSDLSRLHRSRAGTWVRIDAHTHAVLHTALEIAAASGGCFDPSVADTLVAWGQLPRPDSPFVPDPCANWQDIELRAHDRVRLLRPLWLDLGGIAKGYAVDRALAILLEAGATQACVNAGGDLRIGGVRGERVCLRGGGRDERPGAAVEIRDAAIATSAGYRTRRRAVRGWRGAHVHPLRRRAVGTSSSVSVIAPCCTVADALTKVVLAQGAASARVLAAFGARACMHDPWRGWRVVGEVA